MTRIYLATAGTGMTPRGDYNAGTTYDEGSVVAFGGGSYASLVNNNTGNQPDISPSAWMTLSPSGAFGTLANPPSGDVTGATDTAYLNGLAAGGTAYIQLRGGTYWVNGSGLTTAAAERIRGLGKGYTTIKLANAVNPSQVVGNSGVVSDVELADLTIDGNKANQTTNGSGVGFAGSSKITLRNVRVKNTFAPGVDLSTCTDSLIEGCEFESCGSSTSQPSILVSGCTRVRVVANRISSAAGHGIELFSNTTNCTVTANIVDSAGNIGIATGSGSGHAITGNVVTASVDNGIDIGSCTYLTVSGNTLVGCGEGIVWNGNNAGAAYVTITGNTIQGTTGTDVSNQGVGISAVGGPANVAVGVTVSGNSVVSAYGQGILFNGVRDSSITGNTVTNAGQTHTNAGIDIQTGNGGGTNVVVTGNNVTGSNGASGYGLRLQAGTAALVSDNDFSGNAAGPISTATAGDILRNNKGYNPQGSQGNGVPGSGVALAGNNIDRDFYITAATGGCTAAIGSSGPTVTIPAGQCVPVRVPALASITLTYTNAPSWVIEGL